MSALFEVHDKQELLALHRALFEAKFHSEPEQPELAGSLYLAALSNRVVDALVRIDGQGWETWRNAETHRDRFPVIIQRIAETKVWPRWDDSQKQAYVHVLLAPLRAEFATVSEIVERGDHLHREA